ncbi:tRNA pseudouridine synthase-like 1 isoform X1 [Athalia rosae]|uniref:tRNA pseudouridine synthase-like 1 isoform X1 n=1 Tax=Athalia rosae TaxID=37344 RepID=UPI0020338D48|nr:tRNA pseudouridine synthase-like 1 isoform X1 [Athalia rosae]
MEIGKSDSDFDQRFYFEDRALLTSEISDNQYYVKYVPIPSSFQRRIYTYNLTSGLQRQTTSLRTIQSTVEEGLSHIVKPKSTSPIIIQASSRTDAGVHAFAATAHVDLTHQHEQFYNMETIVKATNKYFQRKNFHIRITSWLEVSQDFHARYAATSRSYLYRVIVPKEANEKDVPVAELYRAWDIKHSNFDAERVKLGTKLFLGPKDFQTFAAKRCGRYKNVDIVYRRELDYFTLEKGEPLLTEDPASKKFDYWNFKCGSKAFLYNQVRRMVGALVGLGLGKITEKDIQCMLQVPSHHNWISGVNPGPPHGLYLCRVEYNPSELAECIIRKS